MIYLEAELHLFIELFAGILMEKQVEFIYLFKYLETGLDLCIYLSS